MSSNAWTRIFNVDEAREQRLISKGRRFTGVYFVNDDWPLWTNEDAARDGAGMLWASNIDENGRDTRQVDEIRAPFRTCYTDFGGQGALAKELSK